MKKILGVAIVGLKLEEVVNGMGLKGAGARDTLLALCNRADGAQKDSSTLVSSPECMRLMPELRRYGIPQAAKHLGRDIRIVAGELLISPHFDEKEKEKEEAA
jgi:hypothetical protein